MPANSSFESPVVRGPVVRWSSSAIWRLGLPLALFGILWADLIRQLSYEWSTNEQYAYGWFVPLLALGLLWKRWTTRPAAQPQASPFWLVALVVMVALVLLPVRVVHEINQDWPLFSWPLTLGVVGISLYAIFLLGGWTWVRYLAFPVCFILVAVRWPYRIEHGLTQGLMRVVAGLTVELLGWFNIPAIQHGNLIEVSTGVVGIDEACSGIRSFQSTLMAALFLGELYMLRWPRRLLLIVGGLTLAFCFNVVRTLILTWRASTAGIAALEKWHDPAGLMIFLACFGCLWFLAGKLKVGSESAQHLARDTHVALPRRFIYVMGAWILLLLIGTESWYWFHESHPIKCVTWSVVLPTETKTFQELEMSQQVWAALKCDTERGGVWTEADGSRWSVWSFRWASQSLTSLVAARAHRPEICLPASGCSLQADRGLHWYQVGDLKMPFRTYIFDNEGRPMFVFFCLWQDGTERLPVTDSLSLAGRLWAVLNGRRMLGQQTLEIIIEGGASFEAAEQAVRQRLPGIIKVTR